MSNKHPLVQAVETSQLRKDIPEFSAGDTLVVQVRVKEGDRERLQAFEGVVIAKRNRGINSAFTVRKISSGIGVERVFQTHSPLIGGVEVKRRGEVRRAKLYYLRERTGKAARISERLTGRKSATVSDDMPEELLNDKGGVPEAEETKPGVYDEQATQTSESAPAEQEVAQDSPKDNKSDDA